MFFFVMIIGRQEQTRYLMRRNVRQMELFVWAGEYTPAFTYHLHEFSAISDISFIWTGFCCISKFVVLHANFKIRGARYEHSSSTEARVYVAQPSPVFTCSAILLTCIGGLTRLRA